LVGIPFYLCATWLVFRYAWPHIPRRLTYAGITVSVALLTWGFVFQFHNQARYSDQILPATVEALAIIEEEGPGDGVVTNSFAMAFWIAGINKVPVAWTHTWEPPRAYTAMDENVRCVMGWVMGCNPYMSAIALQSAYVLVDTRFPYYNTKARPIYGAPAEPWEFTAKAPWLELVYEKDTTKLWRIEGA